MNGRERGDLLSSKLGVAGSNPAGVANNNNDLHDIFASEKNAKIGLGNTVGNVSVPASIVGKMVVTPPDQMVWLTVDDLRSMETKMFGKPMQLPTDQPATSQLQRPINLGTQATAPATKTPTWESIVDGAIRISSAQNNGKAKYVRGCQPELKICNSAIFFKDNDGTDSMIKVTKDLNDKIIEREICTFNTHGDIRTCLDWDNGTSRRDMKNIKGDWYKVSD